MIITGIVNVTDNYIQISILCVVQVVYHTGFYKVILFSELRNKVCLYIYNL